MNTIGPITPISAGESIARPKQTAKDPVPVSRDFEALLIAGMLRSAHGSGSGGWLGTGDDDSGETAIGFGEEQLAQAIAKGGGFGLARIIAKGLEARTEAK